jgi:hypothetical protein
MSKPPAFPHATYQGGLPDTRKKTGSLIFDDNTVGIGFMHAKNAAIPATDIAWIDVNGGQVHKGRGKAAAAFGVGALLASGSANQANVEIRRKDGATAYYTVEKAQPVQVKATIAAWMSTHSIPFRDDAGTTSTDSTSAELVRLAELHSTGVLTDDEFATAKTRLLNP